MIFLINQGLLVGTRYLFWPLPKVLFSASTICFETELILHLRECCHVLEAFGRACPSIYDGFFWDLHILVNVHIGTHFAWDDWQIAYGQKCGSSRDRKIMISQCIVCNRYASKWAHHTFSTLFDRCWTDYTSCISLRNPLKIQRIMLLPTPANLTPDGIWCWSPWTEYQS